MVGNYWLFKASLAVGERVASRLTIVVSAVRSDLDVVTYLEYVLRRGLAGETDWATLGPHAWKAEQSESIRVYHQDERFQAADRKKQRRARR